MAMRVMIVDDHRIVLAGLRDLIRQEPDLTVVGEASTAGDAFTTAIAVRPDVVLMDVRLPDGDGIEATRLIKARLPETQVLLLTVCEDLDVALRGLRAGAAGYILKDVAPEHLMNAIRSVQSDGAMLHTIISRNLVEGTAKTERAPRTQPLSEREIAILREVAAGRSDKEIAAVLFLAEGTVKFYLRSAYKKLGIHKRAQAAMYVVRMGLEDLAPAPVHAPDAEPNGKREDNSAIFALLEELIGGKRSP